MPELVNHAPFPNFRYYAGDNRGGEFGVVIVKATYAPGLDGRLEVAEEQAPLLFTDASHGAVNVSSVWHPSDLVPYKPRTDILVNAVARALGGVPAASWLAGVRVSRGGAAVVEKRVRVTGPRRWEPDWARTLSDEERAEWTRHRAAFRGWRLSDPAPVAEVALRYELAFGGTPQAGTDAEGRPVFADDPYNRSAAAGSTRRVATTRKPTPPPRSSGPTRCWTSPTHCGGRTPSVRSRAHGSRGCRWPGPTTRAGWTRSGRTGRRTTTSPTTTRPIPT